MVDLGRIPDPGAYNALIIEPSGRPSFSLINFLDQFAGFCIIALQIHYWREP
jgi:hypothetical protein